MSTQDAILSLTPDLLIRIDAASEREGLTRDEWIERACIISLAATAVEHDYDVDALFDELGLRAGPNVDPKTASGILREMPSEPPKPAAK